MECNKNDRKCANFFGLLKKKGKFDKGKFDTLKKEIKFDVDYKSTTNTAHTNGNAVTFERGFFNDGWFRSGGPNSLKNPRQGRAQTVLHEIGHAKGLLISPDNYGYPTDSNSPAQQNEKKILDECGTGLSQVPTKY